MHLAAVVDLYAPATDGCFEAPDRGAGELRLWPTGRLTEAPVRGRTNNGSEEINRATRAMTRVTHREAWRTIRLKGVRAASSLGSMSTLQERLLVLPLLAALTVAGCQDSESGDSSGETSGPSSDSAASMNPDSESEGTESDVGGFDSSGASDPGGDCFDCPCPDGSLGMLCPSAGDTECVCGGGSGAEAACAMTAEITGAQTKSFEGSTCLLGGTGNPSYSMVLTSDSGRVVITFEPGDNPDGVPFDTAVAVLFAGSAEPDVNTDWQFEGCAATLTTGQESGQLTVGGTVDCTDAELTEIDHGGEDGLGEIDPVSIPPFEFSFWILG